MQQEYYSQAGMEQAIQELITKTINNERGGFNAMLAPPWSRWIGPLKAALLPSIRWNG